MIAANASAEIAILITGSQAVVRQNDSRRLDGKQPQRVRPQRPRRRIKRQDHGPPPLDNVSVDPVRSRGSARSGEPG